MAKKYLVIGEYKFQRHNTFNEKFNFKLGGWAGIVLFVDITESDPKKRYSVNRTMHLHRYLKSINFNYFKSGKFGKKVSKMSYFHFDVYYLELEDFTKIREIQNYLNREINKLHKESTQLSLDFSSKKKRKPKTIFA